MLYDTSTGRTFSASASSSVSASRMDSGRTDSVTVPAGHTASAISVVSPYDTMRASFPSTSTRFVVPMKSATKGVRGAK